MKIKFIDSKKRTRNILCDVTPKECYDIAVEEYSSKYGSLFKNEIKNFLKTISKQELENAKESISMKSNIPQEKIRDIEAVTGDKGLLSKYLNYLESNFEFEKKVVKEFRWNENFANTFNNRSPFDPNKLVTYKSLANKFGKLEPFDSEPEVEEKTALKYSYTDKKEKEYTYGIYKIVLEGTETNFTKFAEFIANKCNESLRASEQGKSGDYNPKEYEYNVQKIKEEFEEKINDIQADIDDFTESLKTGNYADEEEKAELEQSIEDYKKDIEEQKELMQIALENEEKDFKGEFTTQITVDDIKKLCFKDIEDFDYYDGEVMPASTFSELYNITMDSKNWYNAKDVKLKFNFEDTKLVRNGEEFDYFKVNKELEKHYYDSKENISYEKWLSKNPNIITDTLNKLSKGENKPMNDSLKNLKFKFKDGIEIEVLDSEGKSFAEVKDEVIQVHRKMVEKQLKDSEKETKEILEDLGAKATNDSCEEVSQEDSCKDVSPETQEKLDKAEINTTKDAVEDCASQDAVEETEKDKYRVVVNGKEIGIYETMEEAEEAEKKALEAVEKGIPKVEIQDDLTDAEQAAYENARDCLVYGASKNDWDSCGLPEEKANEIWKKAFKDLAAEM